jgi:four helix bundle protein
MQDFKKLLVWQAAHRLRLEVRRVFESCDSRRDFGLRSQTIRAASSIGANIAEGCGKESGLELARFGEIALSSAKEVEDHLLEARVIRLIVASDYQSLASATEELQRMLTGFVHGVRRRAKQRRGEPLRQGATPHSH